MWCIYSVQILFKVFIEGKWQEMILIYNIMYVYDMHSSEVSLQAKSVPSKNDLHM